MTVDKYIPINQIHAAHGPVLSIHGGAWVDRRGLEPCWKCGETNCRTCSFYMPTEELKINNKRVANDND